jgi:2-phosphoglycerate kinase
MPWVVTLVCGASGVGKTEIARRLAARYGVPLGEVDDIVTALQAMTTPEQQPVLHAFRTGSTVYDTAEEIVAVHFAVIDTLAPAMRAVIADHLEFAAPVVFEGDYLTPELAVEFGTRVRAVVVAEGEASHIVANFRAREPASGQQESRAQVSVLVNAELARRAKECGAPVVPARPWATGLDRADAALGGH